MKKDTALWVKTCIRCQREKNQRHTHAPFGAFTNPEACFTHVHVDIVEPLPHAEGKQYLRTMINRFTTWSEAIPLSDVSAESCAKAFYENWIARFGVPTQVTTDRGTCDLPNTIRIKN
ncbi:Retrovirus-related Pol polyprotein from transposon 412-like Protein [Tribolium castaneum]|uniref:Retrovirus-related Pol polyprotein from transposon 412-like Protein n=1 Tax=Tribolium castaneum TaxID=7070 RepID=D2A333_TRICA|nr:Retrovirus-related Pol polyprotein from transposon 412-like Protein [Tribolium castaneum]